MGYVQQCVQWESQSARAKASFNAKREALFRKGLQGGNNLVETMEFAYSPAFNTVGCRHDPERPFRVFSLTYPFHWNPPIGDWVSVGIARPKTLRRSHA